MVVLVPSRAPLEVARDFLQDALFWKELVDAEDVDPGGACNHFVELEVWAVGSAIMLCLSW